MTSWHVTPEYINDNWTEEEFLLLFRMRNRRIRHESGEKKANTSPGSVKSTQMSDQEYFARTGAAVTVVVEEKG